MIKLLNGEVDISGNVYDVLVEFSAISGALYNILKNENIPEDKIDPMLLAAVETGIQGAKLNLLHSKQLF